MCPHIIENIDKPIKNVLKNVARYEFNLEGPFLMEEETKAISFTGLIWRELGKEAFIEWSKFYEDKANTINLVHLAILLFGKLLRHGYKYVQEAEMKYEKNHPKKVHPKPVIHLSDQLEVDTKLKDSRMSTRKRTHVLIALMLEIY
jgi:hypothetical protein